MVVVPVEIPLTTPEVLTVPVDGLELVHKPPVDASVSAVFAPTQTVSVPDMVLAPGNGLTVTTCVAAAVPQLLATV